MPTLPVDQVATTGSLPVAVVKPLALPVSHCTTALGASRSGGPPTVGHPCDNPVPGASEWTTAKPRGTQVIACELEMLGRSARNGISGCEVRFGGCAPT